jgi:hypothetical protein
MTAPLFEMVQETPEQRRKDVIRHAIKIYLFLTVICAFLYYITYSSSLYFGIGFTILLHVAYVYEVATWAGGTREKTLSPLYLVRCPTCGKENGHFRFQGPEEGNYYLYRCDDCIAQGKETGIYDVNLPQGEKTLEGRFDAFFESACTLIILAVGFGVSHNLPGEMSAWQTFAFYAAELVVFGFICKFLGLRLQSFFAAILWTFVSAAPFFAGYRYTGLIIAAALVLLVSLPIKLPNSLIKRLPTKPKE